MDDGTNATRASALSLRSASGIAHRTRLVGLLAAAALAVAACGRGDPQLKFQASDITGVSWGKDFHLFDAGGAPHSLSDYRGKVVMLFFGYTNCPDECPTTMAKIAQAVDRVSKDGTRVQGLFVTVDPARDTPAVLERYVRGFHPTFVGLTANEATIAATAKDFKVLAENQKPDERGYYTVDHSAGIFVFDPQGRLRLFMGPKIWVDAMVHDLKLLLGDTMGSAQE